MLESLGFVENYKHIGDFVFHYQRTNILLYGKAIHIFVIIAIGKVLLSIGWVFPHPCFSLNAL